MTLWVVAPPEKHVSTKQMNSNRKKESEFGFERALWLGEVGSVSNYVNEW